MRRFEERSRTCTASKPAGTSPENEFFVKETTVRFFRSERLSGIFPVNALADRFKSWRLITLLILLGKSPERLLLPREITRSSVALKTESGSDPLKKLLDRSKFLMCGIENKSGVTEPRSCLLGSTKLVTLNMSGVLGFPSSVQVTPVHKHGVSSS